MDKKLSLSVMLFTLIFTFQNVDAACSSPETKNYTVQALTINDAFSFDVDVTSDIYQAIFGTNRTQQQQDLYDAFYKEIVNQFNAKFSSTPGYQGVTELIFNRIPGKKRSIFTSISSNMVMQFFSQVDTNLNSVINQGLSSLTVAVSSVQGVIVLINNNPVIQALNLGTANFVPNFYLFTRLNRNTQFVCTAANILYSPFSYSKRTVFIVHGFTGNGLGSWLRDMKDALLDKEDLNVFTFDWAEGAKAPNYIQAVNNVKIAGKAIASFLSATLISRSKTHCIGHSLGAHVCGFSGKNARLNRISGLDPAGPLFTSVPATERLDRLDADYVDVIHTDAGGFGITEAIADKDFFPNGGTNQPGCSVLDSIQQLDLVGSVGCSHSRGYLLYIESIKSSCRFTGTACSSYKFLGLSYNRFCSCKSRTDGLFQTPACSPMGYYAWESSSRGTFYLDTNSAPPYCKN